MRAIAFTGGGTGGHVFPALALVPYIRRMGGEGRRIFWIGSASGMEGDLVRGAGLEFFGIPAGKLRRPFSLKNFPDLFRVIAGFFAARRILKREKPGVLFSKGGFVSVPPCAAAASLGIPVFTHESDYSPGLATRINARFAEKIFAAYGETAAFFREKARSRVLVTGNPVRPEFLAASAERGRAFLGIGPEERVLLVLGGSLGARELNELVREALPELTKVYTVVHQCGERGDAEGAGGPRYRVFPFIRGELPDLLAASELVLCRCGAGTLWECAALGRPVVMVPLRGPGTRGDQVENARVFEKAGMGLNLFGTEAAEAAAETPGRRLAALASALAADEGRRRAMSEAAGAFAAGGEAGERIAREILARAGEN